MAAKNARLKRRCQTKISYPSIDAAMAHVKALHKKGDRIHAYRCPHCGSFHVGHPPKEIRQAIAAEKRNRAASA